MGGLLLPAARIEGGAAGIRLGSRFGIDTDDPGSGNPWSQAIPGTRAELNRRSNIHVKGFDIGADFRANARKIGNGALTVALVTGGNTGLKALV